MLVLLGPPFEGTEEQYGLLADLTDLVAYDLKTKVKPDQWGVVRVLADRAQADELAAQLRAAGFRIAVVDPFVAHDFARRIVTLRALELAQDHMTLIMRERQMAVPYRALLTIVRGEVQSGSGTARSTSSSSSSLRAVVATSSDVQVFRESQPHSFDSYHAADFHFVTVQWAARLDVRGFDFTALGSPNQSPVRSLDELVDWLAEKALVRVDRGSRHSSLASFAARPPPMRSATPGAGGPPSVRPNTTTADERFTAYSRLVAEAERQTRA
jgi:hypothetical protein